MGRYVISLMLKHSNVYIFKSDISRWRSGDSQCKDANCFTTETDWHVPLVRLHGSWLLSRLVASRYAPVALLWQVQDDFTSPKAAGQEHYDRSCQRNRLIAGRHHLRPCFAILQGTRAARAFRSDGHTHSQYGIDHAMYLLFHISIIARTVIDTDEDIRWVITVPAIWRSSAKQLMREAAYEAGLGSDRLPQQVLISLEPEAASLFCRQLKRHQLKVERPAELNLTPSSLTKPGALKPWSRNLQRESMYADAVPDVCPGQRYMVVDCGGGTVDITVHQVMDLDGRHLKELHRATGGPYGSIGITFIRYAKYKFRIFIPFYRCGFGFWTAVG